MWDYDFLFFLNRHGMLGSGVPNIGIVGYNLTFFNVAQLCVTLNHLCSCLNHV